MVSPWAALRPYAPLFWAAGLLLALELGLEFRAAGRGYRAVLLGRGPGVETPKETGQLQAEFGPTASFPFRSRIVDPDVAASRATVWLASSSYGEDVFMPVESLFATQLAERLQVPVINASHGGTTVGTNLRELTREGPRFRPKLALLYQMSNDIDQLSERLASGLPVGSAPGSAEAGAGSQSFAPVSPWIQQMTTYRQLKSHLGSRLAQHLPLWDDLQSSATADPEAAFRARVEAFVDGAVALETTPVLITFATAYGSGEADSIPVSITRQNLAMNIVLSPLGWTRSVERFNAVLMDVARERDLVCIDLAAELADSPGLFRDLWHFTEAGHARVAELLAERLRQAFPELYP